MWDLLSKGRGGQGEDAGSWKRHLERDQACEIKTTAALGEFWSTVSKG